MTYSNSWYKKEYLLGLGGLGGGAGGILVAGGPITSSSDGYQIKKSLRFIPGNAPYLARTVGTSGDTRRWTVSFWLKNSEITSEYPTIFSSSKAANTNDHFIIRMEYPGGELKVDERTSSSSSYSINTTHKHRDYSAWYHFVIAFDSRESIESERLKIYRNGKRETEVSGSYPAQHYASHWLETSSYANNHQIGREAARSDYETSGYLADIQIIDGLALGPAAFGEFSTTNVWNPKAFALPTPNTNADSPTWSGMCSGTIHGASLGYDKAFDGLTSTRSHAQNGNTITFTPTTNIEFNTLELIVENGSSVSFGSLTVNGIDIFTPLDISSSSTGRLITIHKGQYGINDIDTITWTRTSDSDLVAMARIIVDGVILVDGQTDLTPRNNRNDGTKWSDSSVLARNGSWSAANAAITFDGDLSTTPAWNANFDSAYFKPGWTDIKKIRIYFTEVGAGSAVFSINGTDYKASAAAVGDNAWWTAPSSITTIDSSTGIYWSRVDNNDEFKVGAIEIDGHVLIDNAPDNSFHLKFSDTSLTRYLGKDTLNGKIADATGGLPIYNTSDDYGETKGSGYRADSSAGTTSGTGLVLAIPGDSVASGTCDVHQQVNTGSSNKTVTTSGTVVSTGQSRFYGSALKFDGTDDHLEFADSADFDLAGGDFTIEAWLHPTASPSQPVIIGQWVSPYHWCLQLSNDSNRKIRFLTNDNAALTDRVSTGVGLTLNQWNHIAVVRNSNTIKFYLNGAENYSVSYSNTINNGSENLSIGALTSGSQPFAGYMQDIRIYKGTAKYTTKFTPPTRNDFTVKGITTSGPSSAITYSDSSADNGVRSSGSWAQLFNGDAQSSGVAISQSASTYGVAFDNLDLQCHSSIGVWTYTGASTPTVRVTSVNGDVSTFTGVNNNAWKDWSYTYGNIKKIELGYLGGSGSANTFLALRIDGKELVDGTPLVSAYEIDSSIDSPTSYGKDTGVGGEVRGNFATWNPLAAANTTFSHGNLKMSWSSEGTRRWNTSTMAVKPGDGRFLVEHTLDGGMEDEFNCGFMKSGDIALYTAAGGAAYSYWWRKTGEWYNGSTVDNSQSVSAWADGDVLGVAIDYSGSTGSIYLYKNGTAQNSGNAVKTGLTDELVFLFTGYDTFAVSSNFGDKAYKYPVTISGNTFGAVCTQNLPDTFGANDNALEDKNDPSKYFDIVSYVGSGGSKTIANLGFQPDLLWLKNRDNSDNHQVHDVIRGASKGLITNNQDAEYTDANAVTGFTSTGWTMNNNYDSHNKETESYIAWTWDAGTAASGANNNGSINIASGDQWVNDTSGFSITKFTGTGADATIGHGLSAAPEFVIIKKYSASGGWVVQHVGNTMGTGRLILDENSANNDAYADNYWNSTAPTSTLIHIGDHASVNTSSATHMCYAWRSIPGYSKFGNWTGTGSDPGPFIYLGFRPRYFLMKELDDATNWLIYDSERDSGNPTMFYLYANGTNAGNTYDASSTDLSVDFLSNGVKIRNTNSGVNASGDTYIYSAFAEHPYKTSRAR